jgi:uncharacterized metal-binding protein
MEEKCTCEAGEVLIFPCSGGSNCGQIANQAAVHLTENGIGIIYCLAGIGAHDTVIVDTTKAARRVVAIDGCSTACAKRTIEQAGITVTDWVCVTEEGVSKNHEFKLNPKEIDLIIRCAKQSLARPTVVKT